MRKYFVVQEGSLGNTLFVLEQDLSGRHEQVLQTALDRGIIGTGTYIVCSPKDSQLNAVRYEVRPVPTPRFEIRRMS